MAMDIPLEQQGDIIFKTSLVADEELLYRSIPHAKSNDYIHQTVDELKISSQAFSDRSQKPSVNRASLDKYDPTKVQVNSKDAVVGLATSDVRKTDKVKKQSQDGADLVVYKIDVIHRPTEINFAHAQIEPSPEYETKNIFRKLTESLAFLANQRIKDYGWEIEPCTDTPNKLGN